MTAATIDQMSGAALSEALPITVTRSRQAGASASTLISALSADVWYEQVIREVSQLVRTQCCVDYSTVSALLSWLSNLPFEMPKPFIAVGDEGGIACEWDVGDLHLHITFYPEDAEVYFASPRDEWETYLSYASSKIESAVRDLVIAAHH